MYWITNGTWYHRHRIVYKVAQIDVLSSVWLNRDGKNTERTSGASTDASHRNTSAVWVRTLIYERNSGSYKMYNRDELKYMHKQHQSLLQQMWLPALHLHDTVSCTAHYKLQKITRKYITDISKKLNPGAFMTANYSWAVSNASVFWPTQYYQLIRCPMCLDPLEATSPLEIPS